MATNPITLKTRVGDTLKYTITMKDKSTGLVQDITGIVITGGVKREISDTTNIVEFNIVDRDDTNGVFVINLTSAQTPLLVVNGYEDGYFFDVIFNEGGSPPVLKTKLYGTLVVVG